MHSLQARLVTTCQQTLALGVVLAVLTPAAGVLSLDVVGKVPGSAATSQPALPAELMSATVPTGTRDAEVTEIPLTDAGGSPAGVGGAVQGRTATSHKVVSTPQEVEGYGAVGVTWAGGEQVDEDQITLRVRTRTGEQWSDWQELEYHDEHAPDPDSPDARTARPGTEPTFVGEVDQVQVEAATDGSTELPADLSLAVVGPGEEGATESETPEIAPEGKATSYDAPSSDDAMVLSAKRTIAQPTIFSRAQWGADERIRNKKSLRYGTVNAGFVHHTVNANSYTEAQVPGLLRSIYAYHVKSRGWSDIGYNYLVDRFGRIWEGRYGGVDKPVIGAHTLGYNEYSFAMSAIGNFDTTNPGDAIVQAYGQLFAWKLSLHGVNPASTSQKVGRSTFQAINGHRDAGSTACPGRYLYAQLPAIRTYASQVTGSTPVPTPTPTPTPTPEPTQIEVAAPNPQTNLMGTAHPDLVVRRAADGRGLILPTGGLSAWTQRVEIGKRGWNKRKDVMVSPDLTGDGLGDLVTFDRGGLVRIRAGRGDGTFGKVARKFRLSGGGYSLLTAVGDLNRDGRNDLVVRKNGRLVFLGQGSKGAFVPKRVAKGFGSYVQLVAAGDVTGDGRPDLLARNKSRLYIHPGSASGVVGPRQRVLGPWASMNRLVGGGDYTGDGLADLVARNKSGLLYVLPGRGNGTFGAARGPASRAGSMKHLTGAGNLIGGPGGDLVGVAGKRLVVLANADTFDIGQAVDSGASFAGMNLLLNAGDVNRDGHGDVVARDSGGKLHLYAGNGQGGLTGPTQIGRGYGPITGLSAVGDVTGDGLPDLVGTNKAGVLKVWRGSGSGFRAAITVKGGLPGSGGLPGDLSAYDWVLRVPDLRLRGGVGYLVRERRTGKLEFISGRRSAPRVLGDGMGAYDLAG